MYREGFRNRMKQYKKAREENPGLKYWEWKDIPKYNEGTGSVGMPSTTSADGRTKYVYYDPTMDLEYQNINLPEVTITGNKNAGKRLPMKVPEGSYERFKTLGEVGKTVGSFLPIAGEMIDTYDLATDIKNKNWTNTAIRAGSYFIPNVIEKFAGPIYRGIRNNWRKFNRNLNIGINQNSNYFLGEYLPIVSDRITEKELKKLGIERYKQVPFFDENTINIASSQYKNAQQRNVQSAKEAIKKVQLHNIGKFTPSQLKEINEIFKEDPRYADFISSHPELNPLDIETVDRFVTKQNSFIRGVYSDQDNDELIKSMMTENISDVSKKKGGDRLGTNATGIYVSNSGEIADRFQRSLYESARSDIALLYKKAATDINTPIKERLAAERRRIFPYDIVPGSDKLSYQSLVDLGYVAKEAQYTTRLGNKLPGYERAYISKELDTPNLEINDLQTTKTNLEDKKGRWGIGGVESIPELEDKLFDGFNIGTSYGDYLHLMKTLKSPNLTKSVANPQWTLNYGPLKLETEKLLKSQMDKQIDLKRKVYNNPYLQVARDLDLNKEPIFGIGGTLSGTGAGIYGIMNSDSAKLRERFNTAMDDPQFEKYYRSSTVKPKDYSSSVDYVNAVLDTWNKEHPDKQF